MPFFLAENSNRVKKNPTVLSGAGFACLESEYALPAKPPVNKEQKRKKQKTDDLVDGLNIESRRTHAGNIVASNG